MLSGLKTYTTVDTKYCPPSQSVNSAAYGSNCKGTWGFCTRFHPDLYTICSRWYTVNRKKIVPKDVRITRQSVLLWYLGDGTLINKNNTCTIRLSTDSFDKSEIEDILIPGLRVHNIDSIRNSENRIKLTTASIPQFFNLIGKTSPIECYSYKFSPPEWRFEAKRMSQVCKEFNLNYNKLSYYVKLGKVPCYRASEKGRPRFLNEHIEVIKQLINELKEES